MTFQRDKILIERINFSDNEGLLPLPALTYYNCHVFELLTVDAKEHRTE
ncbi:MAG: hypothetical protein QX203_10785 [Methylococcaceae bacterium]